MMFKFRLLILNWWHTSWRFILISRKIFSSSILVCCYTRVLLFSIRMLIKAFARLSQFVHVLVHVIFVTIIARTATNKIIFLTIIMRLIVRGRGSIRLLLILLLIIYFSKWNTIYSIGKNTILKNKNTKTYPEFKTFYYWDWLFVN